jgi:ABC-type Fe3+-hydroxamate transport system substrate-binding protein
MAFLSLTDQMGVIITLKHPPRRIISLVPSQTEFLYHLGLEERVVGITKFCVHPRSWFDGKKQVGGTKRFLFEEIDHLSPDLIIGNKEENYREGIEALKERYPVWMSDISTLDEAFEMMRAIGQLTDRLTKAEEIIAIIQDSFKHLPQQSARVLYLIWKKPWMAAGRETFIDEMLRMNGFVNAMEATRYPELSEDYLKQLNVDYVFLSSEPYPFKEQHLAEVRTLKPESKVVLVDGEMFSWYGSRLMYAADYFKSIRL